MENKVEQLHVVLQQSFSPDASLRGPAEETIRNLKHVPGATQLLLQIASEKQVRNGSSWRGILRSREKCQNSIFQSGELFN